MQRDNDCKKKQVTNKTNQLVNFLKFGKTSDLYVSEAEIQAGLNRFLKGKYLLSGYLQKEFADLCPRGNMQTPFNP